ncbi:hypothetical protein JHK85_018073 [Glycine max]|nr:hypothetical protein JHK85_018073 [Glycine max]
MQTARGEPHKMYHHCFQGLRPRGKEREVLKIGHFKAEKGMDHSQLSIGPNEWFLWACQELLLIMAVQQRDATVVSAAEAQRWKTFDTYSIKLATCKRRSRLERGEPNGVPTYTPNHGAYPEIPPQQRPEIYTKCTLESV